MRVKFWATDECGFRADKVTPVMEVKIPTLSQSARQRVGHPASLDPLIPVIDMREELQ